MAQTASVAPAWHLLFPNALMIPLLLFLVLFSYLCYYSIIFLVLFFISSYMQVVTAQNMSENGDRYL